MRLLLPPLIGSPLDIASPLTQAAQIRSDLALQDREEAAIQLHVSTMALQTPYSTPQIAWRPNGSGVFVNGDDGIIRGLETKTGKIVSGLQGGHEVGSKIRSIWVRANRSKCSSYLYDCLIGTKCSGRIPCHTLTRGVSLLEPKIRRRNADFGISTVWDDRRRGRQRGVAYKWRIRSEISGVDNGKTGVGTAKCNCRCTM